MSLEYLATNLYDKYCHGQDCHRDTHKLSIGEQAVKDRLILADHACVKHIPPVDDHISSEEYRKIHSLEDVCDEVISTHCLLQPLAVFHCKQSQRTSNPYETSEA